MDKYMGDLTSRINNLSNKIHNFQAKNLSYSISKIEELSENLAQHTILLISDVNKNSKQHWIFEIISWLDKIKSFNKVKTPSGKLSMSKVAGLIYEQPLGLLTDIKNSYINAIGRELDIAPNKVDTTDINFDNYMISLGSIYDDYLNYIYDKMSISELKSRMIKYYLYED